MYRIRNFLFVVLAAFATAISQDFEQQWTRSFSAPNTGLDNGHQAFPTSAVEVPGERSHALLGCWVTDEGLKRFELMKLDSTGSLVWLSRLSRDTDVVFPVDLNASVQTPAKVSLRYDVRCMTTLVSGHGFLIGGEKSIDTLYYPSNDCDELHLVHTDSIVVAYVSKTGAVGKVFSYDGTGKKLISLQPLSDGSVWAACRTTERFEKGIMVSPCKYLFSRLDSLGRVLCAATFFDSISNRSIEIGSIHLLPDGGIETLGIFGDSTGLFFLRLDSAGTRTKLLTLDLSSQLGDKKMSILASAQSTDNGIFTFLKTVPAATEGIWLVKCDANGNLLGYRHYADAGEKKFVTSVASLTIGSDGQLVLFGRGADTGTGGNPLFLAMLDGAVETKWIHWFPEDTLRIEPLIAIGNEAGDIAATAAIYSRDHNTVQTAIALFNSEIAEQKKPFNPPVLRALCSPDTLSREWHIFNPNVYSVTTAWSIDGSDQSDTLDVPPGDNYFSSKAVSGTNTALFMWKSPAGAIGRVAVKSDSTRCPVSGLSLLSLCSDDPSVCRWRVVNPNYFDVAVSWKLSKSGQKGAFTSRPGDTIFSTRSIRSPDKMRIIWADFSGTHFCDLEKSDGTVCEIIPPEVESIYGIEGKKSTVRWSIDNQNLFGVPVRWELCGSSQNGAFYAGPGKTILSIKGAPDTGRLVIFWKDADGAPQQAIVDPADSNRILLPLQISSSRDIDKCELLWRISNPNPFPVLVRWSALGGQKGRTIAQPGETDISTRSIYGTNEITISWKDGAGLHTGNASAILPAKKAGKVSKKHPHGNFGPRYEF